MGPATNGRSQDGSVTEWIDQIKQGNDVAAARLWERYFATVQRLARRFTGGAQRRVADEEDVAVSVFDSLFAGAAAKRFDQLSDRHDLWCLLIVITRQKSVDQRRRLDAKKRGGGRVAAASEFTPSSRKFFDDLPAAEPTPDEVAQLDDEFRQLMAGLRDETLRDVARCRMAGSTVQEIATELGMSRRAVERKLQLVRAAWQQELEHGS